MRLIGKIRITVQPPSLMSSSAARVEWEAIDEAERAGRVADGRPAREDFSAAWVLAGATGATGATGETGV